MEIKAPVNKIINFSNVDGPGNRTSIFFQSCPFRCYYCHNPETIKYCINCGDCVKTCPVGALSIIDKKVIWNKEKCVNCDTCLKTCKHMASPKISMMTSDEIMEIIKRNRPFIRGITVSGGECMNHAEFLYELFKKVKDFDSNLTTFIDSNGYYDFSKYEKLINVTDAVMLDVKAFDNEFHKELCGQDNSIVLKNLDYLLDVNKMYEVRTVLLNNHEKDNIFTVTNTAKIINNRCRYKLIKYRQFGVRKEGLDLLGNYTYKDEDLNKMVEIAKKYMSNVVTV